MPYRRLPNTDAARFKALTIALKKAKEIPPFQLAFSQATYRRILAFMPQFEKAMAQYKSTYSHQIKKNKEYLASLKKAKLYISHFVQVLNMAITRGEFPASTRIFFSIEEKDSRVPTLNTELSVIEWGDKIIRGEELRKMKGLTPVSNPSAAIVKVRFENFKDAYNFQKTLQKDNKRALDILGKLRDEADEIILAIWNEVEESYKNDTEKARRDKAIEYGLIYVYRKNELKTISIMEKHQLKLFPADID